MALYLVFVTDNKELGSLRIKQTKTPYTSLQLKQIAVNQVGARPYLYLAADGVEEIEDKLRESGFDSKIEFIQNYSKVV